MTKDQEEDREARRECRDADDALREAIFHAYAAFARRERQGQAGLLLNENGMTEHERRACSVRIMNDILGGRPLKSFLGPPPRTSGAHRRLLAHA